MTNLPIPEMRYVMTMDNDVRILINIDDLDDMDDDLRDAEIQLRRDETEAYYSLNHDDPAMQYRYDNNHPITTAAEI